MQEKSVLTGHLSELKQKIENGLEELKSSKELYEFKSEYLEGKKSKISGLMKEMKNIAPEERANYGKSVNELKEWALGRFQKVEEEMKERELQKKYESEKIDLTLPAEETAIGKQSRLIVHLQNKRNRFSFCIVMKRKNIIFVFIERASADSRFFRCLLHGKLLHIHQPFGLDDLQKDLRNRLFFDYIILCFLFSHGNPLFLCSFQEIHLFSQERSYHIPAQCARTF